MFSQLLQCMFTHGEQGEDLQNNCKRITSGAFSVCNKSGSRMVVMAHNRLQIICFDPTYFYFISNTVQLTRHLKSLGVQKALNSSTCSFPD